MFLRKDNFQQGTKKIVFNITRRLLIYIFFNDFCYHSINLFFRNAYPCTWIECRIIHHSVLIKFGDKWAKSNLQLWYIGRSYAIIASALTLKLHFVKKQNSSYDAENFFCILHFYDNIFLFRFLWDIPKSLFMPHIVKRTRWSFWGYWTTGSFRKNLHIFWTSRGWAIDSFRASWNYAEKIWITW